MKKHWPRAAQFAAIALLSGTVAHADPFITLSVMGNTDGGTNYFPALNVKTGMTVHYEVTEQIATAGTSNTYKGYTLATEPNGTTAGNYGVNTIPLNLSDSGHDTLGSDSLSPGWTNSLANTPGTPAGQSIDGIYAAQPSGTYVGDLAANQILTGTFVVGSASDSLTAAFNTNSAYTNSGGAKVYAATTGNTDYATRPLSLSGATGGSEVSGDPYVGMGTLTLSVSPAILSLGTSTPAGFGNSMGSITISGSHGGYSYGVDKFSQPAASGYVQVQSFNPAADTEYFALDVHATGTQLTSIVADINGIAGIAASTTPQPGDPNSKAFSGIFSDGGTLVYLTVASGVGTDPFLGFNFANDSTLSGAYVTGIAAVPEPASMGSLGLAAIVLLPRRRATNSVTHSL